MSYEELKKSLRQGFSGIKTISVSSTPYGSSWKDTEYEVRVEEILNSLTFFGPLTQLYRIDKEQFETLVKKDYHNYYHTKQGSNTTLSKDLKNTLAKVTKDWVWASITTNRTVKDYLVKVHYTSKP